MCWVPEFGVDPPPAQTLNGGEFEHGLDTDVTREPALTNDTEAAAGSMRTSLLYLHHDAADRFVISAFSCRALL